MLAVYSANTEPNELKFGTLTMGKVQNFEWVLTLNEFRNTRFSPVQNRRMRSSLVGVYIHLCRTYLLNSSCENASLDSGDLFWTGAKQFFEQKSFRKFGKMQDRWSLIINEILHACS